MYNILTSATDIHQYGIGLHGGDPFPADNEFRIFIQGRSDHHKIATLHQLVHRDQLSTEGFDYGQDSKDTS